MKPEKNDNVNKPSHYQGRYGMESIDALRNFMTPEQLKGFYLGNALKYLLRVYVTEVVAESFQILEKKDNSANQASVENQMPPSFGASDPMDIPDDGLPF